MIGKQHFTPSTIVHEAKHLILEILYPAGLKLGYDRSIQKGCSKISKNQGTNVDPIATEIVKPCDFLQPQLETPKTAESGLRRASHL